MGGLNMKRHRKTVAVVVLAAGIAACAARSPRAVAPLPPSLDRNGDGRVSYDEFAACIGPHLFAQEPDLFARIDADKSGTVSRDEWKQFDATPESAQDFDALDTNHDNQISPDEWQHNLGSSRTVLHVFTHLDTNQDGSLSNDELQQSPIAPLLSISF